ncbi:hypothetical protein ElP_28510 [Tautonia plasticadhaerens]|uniref:Uncharacterized protein n=1 Tax=Tautonia plasticadhaerens TaxID=2527974 RepID=A0A518H296_9BACT|nr:hypothetical protein ElP_28510 [Tautonia plasticadhaerens]
MRPSGNGEPTQADGVATASSSNKKRAEGANQSKLCLRYFPLESSPGFDNRWLAMPYSSIWDIRGKRDFSQMVVRYMDGKKVTIDGPNLKSIADRLEGGRLGDVIQADPMEMAGERHCVTLTVRGDELEPLLQALKLFRTAKVDGVHAADDSDLLQCLVTKLTLEQEKV